MSSQTPQFLLFHCCRGSKLLPRGLVSWGSPASVTVSVFQYLPGAILPCSGTCCMHKTQGFEWACKVKWKLDLTFPLAACSSQSPAIKRELPACCPPSCLPWIPWSGAAAPAEKLPEEALGLLSSAQQIGRGVGLGKQVMDCQEGEGNGSNGWGAVGSLPTVR